MKKKKILIGLLLILALAAFVGCGNDADGDGVDDSGTVNELDGKDGGAKDDHPVKELEKDVEDVLDGGESGGPEKNTAAGSENNANNGATNQ